MADWEGSCYLSVLIHVAQKAHLHGWRWPRGDVGIPLHLKKVQSKQNANASEISQQQGVALMGAGFFSHQAKQQREVSGRFFLS